MDELAKTEKKETQFMVLYLLTIEILCKFNENLLKNKQLPAGYEGYDVNSDIESPKINRQHLHKSSGNLWKMQSM